MVRGESVIERKWSLFVIDGLDDFCDVSARQVAIQDLRVVTQQARGFKWFWLKLSKHGGLDVRVND